MIQLNTEEIKQILPHRPPMLLVDRIIDLVPFESGVGLKNVTLNEPFFPGHFPGNPIMPGVFILEAMAQRGDSVATKAGIFLLCGALLTISRMMGGRSLSLMGRMLMPTGILSFSSSSEAPPMGASEICFCFVSVIIFI